MLTSPAVSASPECETLAEPRRGPVPTVRLARRSREPSSRTGTVGSDQCVAIEHPDLVSLELKESLARRFIRQFDVVEAVQVFHEIGVDDSPLHGRREA